MSEKQCIRETVWKVMKERRIERFPYAWGRIPNFAGAERAAERLLTLEEFENARTVFVAPDSPQRPVRELVLKKGKTLVMPTPRLRSGFVVVLPVKGKERESSTIGGAFTLGKRVDIAEVPLIDLVVQGAVVVDHLGGRLGKGGGYGDREVAALREHGKVQNAKIAITVHDVQIVEKVPQETWDFTVDVIVTPSQVLRAHAKREAVSTYMSYILRHRPPETMSKEGFVDLKELVELMGRKYVVDEGTVLSIVEKDQKGRFEVKNGRVRAVYGHSVPVVVELPRADVDILYHGTLEKVVSAILREGLTPQRRQKVHLSPTIEMAQEVGQRKGEHPVVLKIDARKALEDGVIIEKASESVYVADFIPPEYVERV